MTDEYEEIACKYVENANAIKEIVMPRLEKGAIIAARKIALKAIKNESIEYKGTSRVYTCDISEDLCSTMGGLEGCCKDCEVAMIVLDKKIPLETKQENGVDTV